MSNSYGLVLTGRLRSVFSARRTTNAGEDFDQLQALIDTDDTERPIQTVVCPRNLEEEFEENLSPLTGSDVSLSVGVGNYRKLYYQGLI